jgi:hypothetical protein
MTLYTYQKAVAFWDIQDKILESVSVVDEHND